MAIKFVKILFLFSFFIASLILFLPKKNLYYLAERELSKLRTVISDERIEEGAFSLQIKNADIYAQGIHAAKVEDIKLQIYFLTNTLEVRRVRLDEMTKNLLPTEIQTLLIRYALWDPLHITFTAKGKFGLAQGEYALTTRTLTLILQPSTTMLRKYSTLLRQMNKTPTGEYRYERRF